MKIANHPGEHGLDWHLVFVYQFQFLRPLLVFGLSSGWPRFFAWLG